MKGQNVLELNQETMCEALQVWVDKTLKEGHGSTVVGVEQADSSRSSSYGATTLGVFKVSLNVPEANQP